jgi:group I intron endonuclease
LPGSGVDLTKRIRTYYNKSESNKNSRPISNALFKYGFDNFKLDILEYCFISNIIAREQYYLDLLVPNYNVLKNAYSLLGYKHTDETIKKLKLKVVSDKNKALLSSVHTGKYVENTTREKLSIATAKFKKENPLTPEAIDNIKAKTTARVGVSVFVTDVKTNITKKFTNQTDAGLYLNVTRQAIYNALNRKTLINKRFIITKNQKKLL